MLVVGSCYPYEILITVSAIPFSSMVFHMLFVDVVFCRRSSSVLYTYRIRFMPIYKPQTPDSRSSFLMSLFLTPYGVGGRCHTNTPNLICVISFSWFDDMHRIK